MKPTVGAAFLAVGQTPSGEPHSHGVTGGVYTVSYTHLTLPTIYSV